MASKLGRFFTSIIVEQSAPKLGLSSELSSISTSRLVHSSTLKLQSQQDAAAPPQNKEEDQAASEKVEAKQDADAEEEAEEDYGVNKVTGEIGGPRGPEPTRYGDWEQKGRCSDF